MSGRAAAAAAATRTNPSSLMHHRRLDFLAILVSLFGLYFFSTSFFLAKRSLPHTSTCDEAASLLQSTLGLSEAETNVLQNSNQDNTILSGCWMERHVDSMVIIVVDALRFDFALHHLPKSVGARLQNSNSSKLLQFVADPPTVTMQRLKALATGGLPTFADVSNNMGGATVEEDTWLDQLKQTPYAKRHLNHPSRVAFVGDDTWVDLFPNVLDEAYPYPSFNTRDLDTVDTGCLHHIPDLLSKLRTTKTNAESEDGLEVMIVHFLGVDHVGHTYGPHNEHMDQKLRQMDDALTETLEYLDQADNCNAAFIFGDHGMTEDGNHGGGTEEEINAALFAHFSPRCGIMTTFDGSEAAATEYAQTAFSSIHQIDLVPTIASLLGTPIPYANLGSLVPSLSLFQTAAQTAAALALNAAQVWRYFTIYSSTANPLPHMSELEERLQEAVAVWKEALAFPDAQDSNTYFKACSLFKLFLMEALQLGQRVWTRFDTTGMAMGVAILFLGIVLWSLPLITTLSYRYSLFQNLPPLSQAWELVVTILFVIFQCGVLTFGNSYILEEEHILMYMIGVLGLILFLRLVITARSQQQSTTLKAYASLLIPMASRIGELYISGHGQDPSVRMHSAHHAGVFLSGTFLLAAGRWYLFRTHVIPSTNHMVADSVALLCLGQSWWEKRAFDHDRHGFDGTRLAIAITIVGLPISIRQAIKNHRKSGMTTVADSLIIMIKVLWLVMIVTGPSSAPSALLFAIQASAIYVIGNSGSFNVPSSVLAAFWRFLVRHIFFATNHGCAFSRLQLSAAFVATTTFNFYFAGASLFINTFGWEILGLSFAWFMSSRGRPGLWRWYCLYQWIEMFTSCISVSVLRRHLMVWDIYAPHFLFVAIFMVLYSTFQLMVYHFHNDTQQKSE